MLKKAVSPLIATVLLVAFAVALGAVVINYTTSSTNDLTAKTDQLISHSLTCSIDMTINLVKVDDTDLICYNRSGTDNLEFVVENIGEKDAAGLQIFVLDQDNNPYTLNSLVPVDKHERAKFNISLKSPPLGFNIIFPPQKIEIKPIIKATADSVDLCTDRVIEVEDIEVC
ncbi:MAG: hypothetical protein HGA85_01330 [Nanoarchaeota archaeon]|nr:hypothetical protein [Nanoarchaeota archaeon]